MTTKTINIIVFRAEEIATPPILTKIKASNVDIQATIGQPGVPAYYTMVRCPGGRILLVEEASFKKSPVNAQASAVAGQVILGTAIMCRLKGTDFASVTDADARMFGAVVEVT